MSDPAEFSWRSRVRRRLARKDKAPSDGSTSVHLRTSPMPQGIPSRSQNSIRRTGLNYGLTLQHVLAANPEDAPAGSQTPEVQGSPGTSSVDNIDRLKAFQQLWKQAISDVKNSQDGEKLVEVLRAQELAAPNGSEITIASLISRLEAEMKRVGIQKRMVETMEKIVPHINRLAVIGDIAVSTNPNPAALPWAAVRFLLFNLTAGEEIRAKVVQGIAKITILVFECSVYHELYLMSSTLEDHSISANIRKAIVDALSQCIRVLGLALRRQQAAARALTDAFRVEDFSSYLTDLNDAKNKVHDAGFLSSTRKSTISSTVSRDLKGKTFGASFFFKKGAGNQGSGRHLFAILAYQLALNIPPIRPHILEAVKADHSLAMAPMQIQWQKLIRDPLVKLQDDGFTRAITLVLDALDECDEIDRGQILQLLITTCPENLRVFLTSRPELDIMGHFADDEPWHREIVLHKLEIGTIEADFKVFLRHSLSNFVLEHNRAHRQKHLQLSRDWPGDERFQLLLHKALPLFIAAATFVRMIRDRHWAKSPDYKIDFILKNSSKVNSEYEALYKPVLSLILIGAPYEAQSDVIQSFVDIIGSLVLLASPLSIVSLAKLLSIDARDISGQIDPLRSVLDVPKDDSPIQLLHLSFRDYVLSDSAGDLQVDESERHTKLASRCLEILRSRLKKDICGLVSPATSLSDVEPNVVEEHIPPEIQWSSLTEPSWTVLGPQRAHDKLSFSTDGTLVASLSSATKVVKVWSTKSNECLHELEFDKPIVHDQLSLTKDWLVINFLNSHLSLILDMKTGTTYKSVTSPFNARLTISDDGTLLAGQSWHGSVRIWDLTSRTMVEDTDELLRDVDLVTRIANDNTLLSCSWETIKIWDMKNGRCKETFEPEVPSTAVSYIAAAADATLFAILKGRKVEIWTIDPLLHTKTIERDFSRLIEVCRCIAISANGERVAVGSSGRGCVEIWDVNKAILDHKLEVPLETFPFITFSSDGTKIAYFLEDRIEVRCLPGLEKLTITSDIFPEVSFSQTLAFHGGRLIGTYENSQVQVWDASTGICLFLSDPGPELMFFNLRETFLNTEAIMDSGDGRAGTFFGTYYIGQDSAWVMKDGEKLLWLPPDYRPASVYMSGGTMVIGTVSGRVLFLYLRE
ncbi:vegetatible incompatibility het-e-1 [Fusarium beomiforme]|uniref:Mitochondrial division protein 1 n=1 Tax=Fusarium beomiforme TaxID=44412 RepID=A0A9P5DSY3_9HYPO|nr:vegetatible incompatibility het-e-1 [Fusarium beomiforme]